MNSVDIVVVMGYHADFEEDIVKVLNYTYEGYDLFKIMADMRTQEVKDVLPRTMDIKIMMDIMNEIYE